MTKHLLVGALCGALVSIFAVSACNGDDPGRDKGDGGTVGSHCVFHKDCRAELWCDRNNGHKCTSMVGTDGGFQFVECDKGDFYDPCPSGTRCEKNEFCVPNDFKATINVVLPEIVTADIYIFFSKCHPSKGYCGEATGEWGKPFGSLVPTCRNTNTCSLEITTPGTATLNIFSSRWVLTPRIHDGKSGVISSSGIVYEVSDWDDGDAQWAVRLDDALYYDGWLGKTRQIRTSAVDDDDFITISDNTRDSFSSFDRAKITGYRIFEDGTYENGTRYFIEGEVAEDMETIQVHQIIVDREKTIILNRTD